LIVSYWLKCIVTHANPDGASILGYTCISRYWLAWVGTASRAVGHGNSNDLSTQPASPAQRCNVCDVVGMRESFYDTNGITLHVLDYPGSGPTVLMLHGLTANAHFFPDLAKLVAGDFRVVAINLRGRGRSEKPPSDYTMEDHANDVLGVMDKLKLDSAHLCGHSYGGLLTYYLAAHHPDRVDRCVVLDAPADVDANVLEQIQPALDRLTKMFPSWDEFLDEMRALPYYQGWWEPSIEDYFKSDVIRQVDGRCRPRIHPDHIKQCVEGTLDIDWPKLVGTVAQPRS